MGFGRLPEIESAPLTPQEENMGRLNPRIQFDVILASAPGILRIAQQIAHLVRVAFHLAEFLNGHIHKRMLFAKWIQIYRHQNDVVPRRGHFAVKQNGVILGVMKPQVC